MNQNGLPATGWAGRLLGLVVLAAAAAAALSLWPQGALQGGGVQALESRLKELGIPVAQVTISQPAPLAVEVVVTASGGEGQLSQADRQHQFLADRALTLAYLQVGLPLASYRLVLVNPAGQALSDGTIYLTPDLPSQQLTATGPGAAAAPEVGAIFAQNLDFQGLTLTRLDLPAQLNPVGSGRCVDLTLTTGAAAAQTDRAQIGALGQQFGAQVAALNRRFDTGVVVVHVQITDAAGRLLVDDWQDLETGKESLWLDEAYVTSWLPSPAPPILAAPPGQRPSATPPSAPPVVSATARPAGYPAPGAPAYP